MHVAYGSITVVIPHGCPYACDSFGRAVVGYGGSVDPPRGKDGEPLLPGAVEAQLSDALASYACHTASIKAMYDLGKAGKWADVEASFAADPSMARRAAHYANSSSGWTLLHQAAYYGNDAAVNLLVKHGANPIRPSKADGTPGDVATKYGHGALAARLRAAGGW